MILVKQADVYAPGHMGVKDVLICNEKIEYIADSISCSEFPCTTIDGTNKRMIPGLIDNHVHITGGGGEGSFHTRTPEIQLSEIIQGGITTVMGLIGTDGITRSVENLFAKTNALKEEGISAYMFTGAYCHPGPTITGSAERDITFIDEILGLKLAISDHRAPNVTVDQLIQIASQTRVAGMLSGKPGVVVLHMGDARSGLTPVFQALEQTAIPARIFRPTHMNRNAHLMEEGYTFLEMGGYVDYTCAIKGQATPYDGIKEAKRRGLPLSHITMSSDGHGSWSHYAPNGSLLEIGVSGVSSIYEEFCTMVKEHQIPIDEAITYCTSNVAKSLDLYPKKGCIASGSDADFLLIDSHMSIETVLAGGKIMMQDYTLQKIGTYEKAGIYTDTPD